MTQTTLNRGTMHMKAVLAVVLAAIVAFTLAGTVSLAQPATAHASTLTATKAASTKTTAIKNAKTIIKKSKATKGTAAAKLKKIYTFIAKDKTKKGVFTYGSYHGDFYFKALGTANAKFYPATPPKNLKNYYLKYAVDAFKSRKASCYHYASLFAVAAKQALGKKAVVRIAVGGTNVTGTWNAHHAWVEVKMGKKTYVYDPMNGNYWSLNKSKKATGFGKFCGYQKTKVKAYYKNYKGAKYATVTL